jgi:hypothetical protein
MRISTALRVWLERAETASLQLTAFSMPQVPDLAARTVKLLTRARQSGINCDMTGLRCDTIEPGADSRVRFEVEAPLVRDVRVCVERDVRDRIPLSNEKRAAVKVALDRIQRGVAR